MFSEAEGDDRETRDAGVRLDVLEGCEKLVAVVDAGAEHDLRVDLVARLEEALEHLDAARGVAPDELATASR